MAVGPQKILEEMQGIANDSEIQIDNAILNWNLKITKTEKSVDFIVNIEELCPRLTQDIWNEMLRKKYILAGWKAADWITPINKFETHTIKFTK